VHLLRRPHAGQTASLESEFEEMRHAQYSLDLASSDYSLFPDLKNHLRGLTFSTDDELS